jgi:DNA-directed RNA polymerase subunit N
MIIPVRCFTCGKPIGQLEEEYKLRVEAGEEPKVVMDDLGLERYCCRRMFLTNVDLMEDLLLYSK